MELVSRKGGTGRGTRLCSAAKGTPYVPADQRDRLYAAIEPFLALITRKARQDRLTSTDCGRKSPAQIVMEARTRPGRASRLAHARAARSNVGCRCCAGPGRACPMSIGGRCVTVSAVRKRTPPAKRPGNNWPIPLFDATAQPPDDRVDDADEGSDPRAVMEAVLMGFAQITDPVETEVLGSMFLGAIGFLGADVAAVAASELVAVIEAVGDPRAAGMLAVLAALGEGRIGEAAAAGLDRLRACGVAAPEWMAALSAPVTARDCVELCEDGQTLVLAARFDRAGAAHAVMILLDPQDCGEAAEIMLLDSSDLTEALAELRRNAKRDKVRLTTTAIDPAEFRWRAEAAMDARDHHDRDDQDDPDDPDDHHRPG